MRLVTTLMDITGVALVVAGVAFIFWPAALIVAGAGFLWASWVRP